MLTKRKNKKIMNSSKRRFRILFGIIWVLVFIAPFLRGMQDFDVMRWNRIIGDWIHLFFYFIVFLANFYFFVPKLLFNDRRTYYFSTVSIAILVVTILDILVLGSLMPSEPHQLGLSFAPHSLLGNFFNNLITGILIIGTSTAFELEEKWLNAEKLRKDIEKEQLKINLALLRNQVSPHFFMNTLNNIHSLIEMDADKAQDAVERLSTMMRYMLYDSAQNTIELRKEVEFIQSFIALMQLRHSDEVEVTMLIPEQIRDIQIPPMLFISLLENAFKHGVSYPKKSYIYFELKTTDDSLNCIIRNSKHNKTPKIKEEYSGIGLNNIKKSLKLLYVDKYSLDIADKATEFQVTLIIPT